MALRKVPGALALGLLASLIAHSALFGGTHSMGGDYHGLLLGIALAGGVAMALVFGTLACASARTASGSLLAVQLSSRLPGFGMLLGAAAAWYAFAEFVEPHHAATPWAAVALFLAIASWLVLRLSRYALAVLARAVLAVFGAAFAERKPSWLARPSRAHSLRRVRPARRRFARPPPIGIAVGA